VQVIATISRVLGQEHPGALASMANLAATYENQGRWDEAKGLEVRFLKTSPRVFGQEHPSALAEAGSRATGLRDRRLRAPKPSPPQNFQQNRDSGQPREPGKRGWEGPRPRVSRQ